MVLKNNHKWWILFTACLLTVMLNIDATAVNVAVPVIAHQLHATLANMQWVINAFVLFSAMFQIIGGRSGDIYGHRKIYVIGTIIFVIASALSGLAINSGMLILGRGLQGFALGIAYPMTMALILSAFSEEEHGVAIGVVMGTMGVSLAVGPTIGGLILHYIGWRWIFFINLPIGIFTVICTFIFCPKDIINEKKEKLNLTGGLFLCLGLLGVILALNQSQVWGTTSPAFLITMLGGILSIIILYFVDRNKSNQLVDFALFKQRNFAVNTVLRIIAQMIFLPVLFFIPIYLQNILLISPIHSGLILLICTLFVGIISPVAGKLVDKYGFKTPNILSMMLFTMGCFLFVFLTHKIHPIILFSALALIGIGTGINFVSTTSGALSEIATDRSGVATGVFFTIVWGACALGVAFFGIVLTQFSSASLGAKISHLHTAITAAQHHDIARASQGLSPVSMLYHQFSQSLAPKIVSIAQSAYMHGFQTAFLFLAALSIIGFGLSFLCKKT